MLTKSTKIAGYSACVSCILLWGTKGLGYTCKSGEAAVVLPMRFLCSILEWTKLKTTYSPSDQAFLSCIPGPIQASCIPIDLLYTELHVAHRNRFWGHLHLCFKDTCKCGTIATECYHRSRVKTSRLHPCTSEEIWRILKSLLVLTIDLSSTENKEEW